MLRLLIKSKIAEHKNAINEYNSAVADYNEDQKKHKSITKAQAEFSDALKAPADGIDLRGMGLRVTQERLKAIKADCSPERIKELEQLEQPFRSTTIEYNGNVFNISMTGDDDFRISLEDEMSFPGIWIKIKNLTDAEGSFRYGTIFRTPYKPGSVEQDRRRSLMIDFAVTVCTPDIIIWHVKESRNDPKDVEFWDEISQTHPDLGFNLALEY
jgi:hypothetical protein